MDTVIKAQEDKHLKTVRTKVINAKSAYENRLQVIGKENLERLKDLRESSETGLDFEFLLMQLGEKNEINLRGKFNRLQELESMCHAPYFARIDLSDPKDKKLSNYYIGKFGYTEKTPVIIDWRAKVASVYYRYRYPQKNVCYETARGKETKDLTLKRTFEIEDGKLFKYYNNDLQLDESEIIIEKIKKRTGGVLEDIVETIQLSQLDIIEADPRQICIVQGCVGSGKSTVAIHKLAHIFFNYPNLIHPQRAILVAKNQILSGYLSTLFPKLGIFDINYKTLRELAYHVIFREGLGINVNFDQGKDTGAWDIKKISKIRAKIEKIHNITENRINDIFSQSEFISFKGLKYSRLNTPYENLSEILMDLEEEVLTEKNYLKENPNSQRTLLYKENLRALRKLIDRLSKLKSDLKNKILKEFTDSLKVNVNSTLDYTDTLLYIYLFSEIIGISKFPKYEYCVVDEGQDVSPLEYLLLNKLVVRGRFAIFGDLNQSLEPDGIKKWEDISKVIREAKKASTFELETNYRSTKQIIDLAKHILLPYTKKFMPKSINRSGVLPLIKEVDNEKQIIEEFKRQISLDVKRLDKSVGIICINGFLEAEARKVLNSVYKKSEQIIELSENTKISYTPTGLYLMNVQNCKGLEFSRVYVLGLNLKQIETLEKAKEAFVAVTRAMNELNIIGVK